MRPPRSRVKRRGVGRPKRTALDSVRTMAWFRAVERTHGGSLLSLSRSVGLESGSIWTRYRDGICSPPPPRVAAVDAVLPGTARWYESPLWSLLDVAEIGRVPLRPAMEWIEGRLRAHFVRTDSAPDELIWRTPTKYVNDFFLVLSQVTQARRESPCDTLNEATALACLVHEAVIRQDPDRLTAGAEAWSIYCDGGLMADAILSYVPREPFIVFRDAIYMIAIRFGGASKFDAVHFRTPGDDLLDDDDEDDEALST